ncbi:flagellar hook-basal body complex protein FliE [Allosphingosinicella deserti]|uniref:Flagellar hook-basal body complex protein FliE n=1 Tax=Allosphingosinicella deserti TaxID=2116704 RepID=A0A2P7QGL4_9SPHN|nr:flagellar hook-basal body complex protein FliE [Sphingomonas deserti]PSJ37083.1 flagellar hook-basal body complex protein FliE [Sphingomonas deserti]
MSIGALDATSAYGRILGTGKTGGSAGLGGTEESGETKGGFGSMVESMITDAAGSMRTAEAASAKQVAGKGDLIDVVTAIGAAEMALDTVVAVRDKVVGAYSDIMRMQI